MIEQRFNSIDDYLKELTQFNIYATQRAAGQFLCQKRDFELPKLIVGDRFVSTSMAYQTMLYQEFFCIVIVGNAVEIAINGQKLTYNQLQVFTSNQEILIHTPNHSYHSHIMIPTAELVKYLGMEQVEKLKKVTTRVNIIKNGVDETVNDQKQLVALIHKLLNQNAVLNDQALLDAKETVMDLLCKLLTPHLQTSPLMRHNHSRKVDIVVRSLNYIHENKALNITIPDLASVSFCCLRSLEYAFSSVLSMTPKQYVIKRRLQLIHIALKGPGKISIGEITETFGIVNQGRFAQDYYKFFKEYPHQTRRQETRIQ